MITIIILLLDMILQFKMHFIDYTVNIMLVFATVALDKSAFFG